MPVSNAPGCAEVASALLGGAPLTTPERGHLSACRACREVAAADAFLSDAGSGDLVPLLVAPTLEDALQSRRQVKRRWAAAGLAASVVTAALALAVPFMDAPGSVLPLPVGEGWGEGRQSVAPPGVEPLEATFARVDRIFERDVTTDDFSYRRFGALPEWLYPDAEPDPIPEDEEEQTP